MACSLPANRPYRHIAIDCYRQIPDKQPVGWMLHQLVPRELQALSELAEALAKKHLKAFGSTLTFRLFILNHGGIWQDRADMTPVYRTTYGICEFDQREGKPMIIDRFIDFDFVECVSSKYGVRCKRCRGGDKDAGRGIESA